MKSTGKLMDESARQRNLILFPGTLGDFICFLPALESLARKGAVDLLARTEFGDLAPPPVKVRSLECYEIRRLFAPGAVDEKQLREFFESYTSVFSWMGSRQDEFVRALRRLCRGRANIYPFRPHAKRMHQTDYYLSCLGEAHRNQRPPEISPKPEAVAWSENHWAQHSLEDRPVLALAPGSGAREKNWPASFYQAVGDWWRHRTQGAVAVIIGPVEEERGGLDILSSRNVVARNLSLARLAAVLARSNLYLGNDSGVTHLAAAMGIRTIALFGPSDVNRWAPRGENVMVLHRSVACSPCEISVMKSCPHRKCLTALEPNQVIRELDRLPEMATLTRGGVEFRLNSGASRENN